MKSHRKIEPQFVRDLRRAIGGGAQWIDKELTFVIRPNQRPFSRIPHEGKVLGTRTWQETRIVVGKGFYRPIADVLRWALEEAAKQTELPLK